MWKLTLEQLMDQGWNQKKIKNILKQTKMETQYNRIYGIKQKQY